MKRKDIPVCWSVADRGIKVEMGWSPLDTWVQAVEWACQCGRADDESRHVWLQADNLDAQGTIVVPVDLNNGSYDA
jgi:hypothetical protein